MVNEKNEAVFGNGIAELLEEIEKNHSMLEASRKLNMSYRYALHRITLAEKRLDQLLVKRRRGGAEGGGVSEVTHYGKELATKYRKAQKEIDEVLSML
jgi:molybdate transport system regulatory protein